MIILLPRCDVTYCQAAELFNSEMSEGTTLVRRYSQFFIIFLYSTWHQIQFPFFLHKNREYDGTTLFRSFIN